MIKRTYQWSCWCLIKSFIIILGFNFLYVGDMLKLAAGPVNLASRSSNTAHSQLVDTCVFDNSFELNSQIFPPGVGWGQNWSQKESKSTGHKKPHTNRWTRWILFIVVVGFMGALQTLCCFRNTGGVSSSQCQAKNIRCAFFQLQIVEISGTWCVTNISKSVCALDLNILLPIWALRRNSYKIHMQQGQLQKFQSCYLSHTILALCFFC